MRLPLALKARFQRDEGGGCCVRGLDRRLTQLQIIQDAGLSRWTQLVGVSGDEF